MIDVIVAIILTVLVSKPFQMDHGGAPLVILPCRRSSKPNVADLPAAGLDRRKASRMTHTCPFRFVSFSSRLSPQQSSNSPKVESAPTRVSSRRSRSIISTPLSPSNNLNHSSNSSSNDLATTNSSSMNLILTRHQQQWTTTPTIASTNQR